MDRARRARRDRDTSGAARTMSGKLLDTLPAGVVGADWCRTLLSWDTLELAELVEGYGGGRKL